MSGERRWTLIFAWGGAFLFAASLVIFAYSYVFTFARAAPAVSPRRARLDISVNVGLFTLFALHHSLLARTRAKAFLERIIPVWLERSLYTWIASILFMTVCLLWRPLPGEVYRLTGGWALAGYSIQILGLVMTVRAASRIGLLDLAGVEPLHQARHGRSPVHVPLHTTGLYGVVRHPLYLAWALIMSGTPHMTATRFVFAIVSTAYLALAIPLEERGLVSVFGDEYQRYRRQVRWRMMPGIY